MTLPLSRLTNFAPGMSSTPRKIMSFSLLAMDLAIIGGVVAGILGVNGVLGLPPAASYALIGAGVGTGALWVLYYVKRQHDATTFLNWMFTKEVSKTSGYKKI